MGLNAAVNELGYRVRKRMRGADLPAAELQPALAELRRDAITVLREAVDPKMIGRIRNRYRIEPGAFEESEKSLSFAPADGDILKLLLDDRLFDLLRSYYGRDAVLQTRPVIVITKPMVGQAEFSLARHHYPANWHVDYRDEVVIHVPLFDITPDTSHTVIATGSHMDFRSAFRGKTVGEDWVRARYEVRQACARAGDAIVMDTGALHRAELNRASFRCHIHLKFTSGNDLLWLDSSHPKVAAQIELLKQKFTHADFALKQCGDFDLSGLDARQREYLKVLA